MGHSKCIIGNSSAGIRESASFGIPCVNIGIRQDKRERNKNTIDCTCDIESISAAIELSLKNPVDRSNVYYKPNACHKIANDIKEVLDGQKK